SLSMNGTEDSLMECTAAETLIQPAAEQAKTVSEVGSGEGKRWLSLAAGIAGIYSWMFGLKRRQSDKTWHSARKRAKVQSAPLRPGRYVSHDDSDSGGA